MIIIEPILAFNDNYIWCIYDNISKEALVVDPGDANQVGEFLSQKNLSLSAILITHHHPDHTGGILSLKSEHNVQVYGPNNDDIIGIDTIVSSNQSLALLGISFKVLAIPGHTLDHIAYYSECLVDAPAVFCGDTLFAGGCGRVFEGTYAMMLASLNQLRQLPANTNVYCAHEYTLANLEFAKAVEPHNLALINRIEQDTQKRALGQPTIPSTIQLERETNPFLRCHTMNVIEGLKQHLPSAKNYQSNVEVFTALREWKNNV